MEKLSAGVECPDEEEPGFIVSAAATSARDMNGDPDGKSALSGDLSRKLLVRAAKARVGRRAYAQRQKDKQGGALDPADNISGNAGVGTTEKNNEYYLSAPDDETSSVSSSFFQTTNPENVAAAAQMGHRHPIGVTEQQPVLPRASASLSFRNDDYVTQNTITNTPALKEEAQEHKHEILLPPSAPVVAINTNTSSPKNDPASPVRNLMLPTTATEEEEKESAVFPLVHAYKNAKRLRFFKNNNADNCNAAKRHPSVVNSHEEDATASSREQHKQEPLPKQNNNTINNNNKSLTLEPYICKLERFEFFSTLQAYYIVACDKHNAQYRVLRMDRTRMERTDASVDGHKNRAPSEASTSTSFYGTPSRARNPTNNPSDATTSTTIKGETILEQTSSEADSGTTEKLGSPPMMRSSAHVGSTTPNNNTTAAQGQAQNTLQRPLAEFCHEDSHTYTQLEIQDMLDMIHHGNQSVGGLHPVTKAYGIVGIFRFLDCYYLTLITKRTKVGSIAGHGVYTIKQTETYPLKPSWTSSSQLGDNNDNAGGVASVGAGAVRANRSNIVPTSLTNAQDPSSVLLSMWNRGKRSVGLGLSPREIAELRYQGLYQVIDLTKNFYFSYTYDMTRSLQENILIYQSRPYVPPQCKEMYCWNWYLAREHDEIASWPWMLPIIHGAYVQRQLHDYGRVLQLILVARRSRHFAGTRYLKRGVSDRGTVANDVEHEQMLQDECNSGNVEGNSVGGGHGVFSSYLQMRGSIPVYWSQESSVTIPKPPIVLNRVDPTYRATQIHFEHLFKRYGSPIVVLDLVKQSEKREREVIVGDEYRHAVDYLNCTITNPAHRIRYCALDYSHISKHRNLNISTSLNEVATWAVNQTGFFCSSPKFKIESNGAITYFNIAADAKEAKIWSDTLGVPVFCMEQKGVLRTNCIDCLDRTNVAQFSAGVMALAQQLVVMGIRSSVKLDPSSNIVRVLIDMYVDIGDHLALQYGGSEAHKKGPTAGTSSGTLSDPTTASIGKHKELLTSIRRYYSNAFTDRLKQDAMNLFLGYYVPSRHSVPLWDIQDDFYLHNVHVRLGGVSMDAHCRAFGFDFSDDDEDGHEQDTERTRAHSPLDPSGRVYRKCLAQERLRGMWWRAAVQSYIQQRMWMQLVRENTEVVLPPRYDRIYQPEKLAQFDKLFSRSWAVPLRLSHAAQHSQPDAADICTSHYQNFTHGHKKENISPLKRNVLQDAESSASSDTGEDCCTVKDFVANHGFKAKSKPSLAHFLNYRRSVDSIVKDYPTKYPASPQEPAVEHSNGIKSKVRQQKSKKDKKNKPITSHPIEEQIRYISEPPRSNSPCSEYLLSSVEQLEPDKFIKHHHPVALSEFAESLYETSLDSNDVDGILRLSKSAHISRVLESGPYMGLRQDESAIQITNALFEKYDSFLQRQHTGEIPASSPSRAVTATTGGVLDGLDYHHSLQKLGYDTAGVKETIAAGCERFTKSRRAFSEMLESSSLEFKRSDLTTESSLRLYCSMFDDQQVSISQADVSYILGEKKRVPCNNSNDISRSTGVTTSLTAADVRDLDHQNSSGNGSIVSQISSWLDGDNHDKRGVTQLPSFLSAASHIKPGFEQINDDLYARNDNKFLVLNGAGVESWTGSQPLTKLGGLSQDFFVD